MRQTTPATNHAPTTSTHGILHPLALDEEIAIERYPAGADLDRYVERYWSVRWDLRDREPYRIELIPHPCMNVTFAPGLGAEVHGVGTRKSVHPLAGAGWVFGVKFRPGGFFAYSGVSAASLTDRSVPLAGLFGSDADALTAAVLATTTNEARIALLESFLRERLPQEDQAYDVVLEAIRMMLNDRTVTRVTQVARRLALTVRSLQRLFQRYVGVGPKWVIRRYRMHDGAERLSRDAAVDPAALAVELGWFDQAHFTRDFSALVGLSPLQYAALYRATGDRDAPFVRS